MKLKLVLQVVIILMLISLTATSMSSDGDDTEAPLISVQSDRGLISETWATIHWETNELAIGGIEWGLSPQYGNIVKESGNYTTQHSINITGLTRDTDYYIIIFATDQNNNTGYYSFELGTYPRGRNTTSDYFWIISAIVSAILVLIVAMIVFHRWKNKK